MARAEGEVSLEEMNFPFVTETGECLGSRKGPHFLEINICSSIMLFSGVSGAASDPGILHALQ